MNVTLNKTDSVNAVITIEVVKADYENEVEKSLKDLRKNAVIPGFRKGMVPPSLLRQKYGKSVLVEEINKLVSQSLSDFIKDKKPEILGEPLNTEGQEPVDFDRQEDFTFSFDVGLSPEINVELTKEDQLPYYKVKINKDMVDRQIENIKAQNGFHDFVEDVEEKDMVKGLLIELDENKEPKPNGITQENAVVMPKYIKVDEERSKFLNAKLHSIIIFNPYSAYEGNTAELSSFLKIKKEEVDKYKGDFSFEINEISRYKEAEINQELFDKLFDPGTVNSEKTFRAKIKEDLVRQLAPESDYKFISDIHKLLEEKTSDMVFPDAFLKRWLLVSDSKLTPESIEEEYPKILKDLKIHLIREHLIEENGITIEENELKDYARHAMRAQFAQLGIHNIPDDSLENYAQDMLKKKETYRSLGDKIFEDKLIKILKEQVTLMPQEITFEAFQKLIT